MLMPSLFEKGVVPLEYQLLKQVLRSSLCKDTSSACKHLKLSLGKGKDLCIEFLFLSGRPANSRSKQLCIYSSTMYACIFISSLKWSRVIKCILKFLDWLTASVCLTKAYILNYSYFNLNLCVFVFPGQICD